MVAIKKTKFTIKDRWDDSITRESGLATDFKAFCEAKKSNLRSANLYSANLESANLESANLESANLYSANLRSANLRSANLRSANLYSANLRSANLRSANLRSANLSLFCKWAVSFSPKNSTNPEMEKEVKVTVEDIDIKTVIISIGCRDKTITEWDKWFDSDEEYSTKRDTFDFKQIKGCYLAYKAYLECIYREEEVKI